jgi:hypothetical protein
MTSTGRTVGRYVLGTELGRGGMGVVYEAHDPAVGRTVAIKVIAPEMVDDGEFVARFEREMRIAATLEHPNVVPVYETGRDEGSLFIAMRRVLGSDLRSEVRDRGALAPARVARLARQIGAALDAAHARGLVHRDVKPGNVLLAGDGDEEHVYLTDFGLTREAASDSGLTNTGQWLGTVDYVAPEQLDAGVISGRTDIYAMACMLYELLAGRLPYTGTIARKLAAHTRDPLPSVGEELDHVDRIDRALARGAAKEPEDRYPSAGDLGRALAAAIAGTEPAEEERTVATGAALSGIATQIGERARPIAREVSPTVRRPRTTNVPGAPPGRQRPALGRRRVTTVGLATLALLLVAGGAVAALLGGGSSTGTGTGGAVAMTSTVRPAIRTRTVERIRTVSVPGRAATATAASEPVARPFSYRAYTAPQGGFTTVAPSGGGWRSLGETAENPRLLRSTFVGPGGATIWIDATPQDAPTFALGGRHLISRDVISSPLGQIDAYSFTASTPSFCSGGCVDYQLDLGGSGYAVLGGATADARSAARRIVTSLVPTGE